MTERENIEANGWIRGFLETIKGKPRKKKIKWLNQRGTNSSFWKEKLNEESNKKQSAEVLDPIIRIITTRLAKLLGDLILLESASVRKASAQKREDGALSELRDQDYQRAKEEKKSEQTEINRRARQLRDTGKESR